ncbi:hypothetical protein BP6252_11164 [Coleophoma cylindrospora]|uniref:Nephrocystin 3-like N-terminal domain-containing protein n=1 Tax=Coleophoma cylindrospora TaxID=1849047 RepID=A0A3D8QP94_9HELO|nr:hypothetical protein BP6252_11164 [Coleophoma cylindrospora]
MEAIATLSLVCNVMQVISFSGELLRLCHHAFKHGGAEPTLDVSRFSSMLTTLQVRIDDFDVDRLATNDAAALRERFQEPEIVRLRSLASDLLRDSIELQSITQKVISSSAKGNWVQAVRTGVEHKLKYQREITTLEVRIGHLQRQLDTELLTRICSTTQATAIRSSAQFSKLDTSIQNFITLWSQGNTDISEMIATEANVTRTQLEGLISTEAVTTRSHFISTLSTHQDLLQKVIADESSEATHQLNRQITSVLEVQDEQFKAEKIAQGVLASLWFSEMNARENAIEDASEDTVKWIFGEDESAWKANFVLKALKEAQEPEESTGREDINHREESGDQDLIDKLGIFGELNDPIYQDIPPRCRFKSWLESNRSDKLTFWISGKPGSGKSTLMKFLIHNDLTISFLRKWKPDVHIYRFYFIEFGINPLQRQIQGCLRTLLHQLFDTQVDFFRSLLETKPGLAKKQSEHDWSIRELQDTLFEALSSSTSAYCIFLDGLDEIDVISDGRFALVDMIKSLEHLPNLKVCVSSRPETPFRQAMKPCPSLNVHELTWDGIRTYATTRLNPYRAQFEDDIHHYEKLVWELVKKADGVFLWVALAIRSVIRGITNGDGWDILYQRIEKLPPGLDALYQQMWTRQNQDWPQYKVEAAELFWYALNVPRELRPHLGTTLGYVLGTHGPLYKRVLAMLGEIESSTDADDISIRNEYENWMSTRSVGLLEITRTKSLHSTKCFPYSSLYHRMHIFHELSYDINFIHRSVREFLVGTNFGHDILSWDKRAERTKWLSVLETWKVWDQILAMALSNKDQGLNALEEYAHLIVCLAIAGHLGEIEELSLLNGYNSVVRPHYGLLIPDEDFLAAITRSHAVIFSPKEHGSVLASRSSFLAELCDFDHLYHRRTFDAIVQNDDHVYHINGNHSHYEVKMAERLFSVLDLLLCAGTDPNETSYFWSTTDCDPLQRIPLTPWTRFLDSIIPIISKSMTLTQARDSLIRTFNKCIKLFLAHGADKSAQVVVSFDPGEGFLGRETNLSNGAWFSIDASWLVDSYQMIEDSIQSSTKLEAARYSGWAHCLGLIQTQGTPPIPRCQVPHPQEHAKKEKLEIAFERGFKDMILGDDSQNISEWEISGVFDQVSEPLLGVSKDVPWRYFHG